MLEFGIYDSQKLRSKNIPIFDKKGRYFYDGYKTNMSIHKMVKYEDIKTKGHCPNREYIIKFNINDKN